MGGTSGGAEMVRRTWRVDGFELPGEHECYNKKSEVSSQERGVVDAATSLLSNIYP